MAHYVQNKSISLYNEREFSMRNQGTRGSVCRISAVFGLMLACAGGVAAVPPPQGTAPVVSPAGGFGIDGDLMSGTPDSAAGDWLAGPNGGAGVLDAAG